MGIHRGRSCKAEAREKQARGQVAQKADSVALAQAREKRSGCQDGITVRVNWSRGRSWTGQSGGTFQFSHLLQMGHWQHHSLLETLKRQIWVWLNLHLIKGIKLITLSQPNNSENMLLTTKQIIQTLILQLSGLHWLTTHQQPPLMTRHQSPQAHHLHRLGCTHKEEAGRKQICSMSRFTFNVK